jgi:hypothetical protein
MRHCRECDKRFGLRVVIRTAVRIAVMISSDVDAELA